jgi:site-specific DNA recombinase
MRFAYLGRTSDEDAQDPSLSIPRQLASCEAIVNPLGDAIVAHYWDIESGRKLLDVRGNGANASRFNISTPRDGGINDLIRDASTGRFDAVIVESIDRVSRMTADSTRVERELEQAGVSLFAADEPLNTNATSILTRRVKQGIAEWYVRDLMEKSRRGMEESVRQGWHTGGRAPYGYMLEEHPHPNPSKAREGKHKHRLVIDPVRAPVVLMIFEDYCVRRIGLGAICNKLNRNIEKYPPPVPKPRGQERPAPYMEPIRHQRDSPQPQYTGFNVWGETTSARATRRLDPAISGCGAPRRPRSRSCRGSYSTWWRNARSGTPAR